MVVEQLCDTEGGVREGTTRSKPAPPQTARLDTVGNLRLHWYEVIIISRLMSVVFEGSKLSGGHYYCKDLTLGFN